VRSAAKHFLEAAIISLGIAHVRRRRRAGRGVIFAYHNIVPDDARPAGDRPNHLPLSVFAAQLAELRATHDVVPLSDLITTVASPPKRPQAAITFDDAYRGAVVYGIDEVVRQGMPATIFVAPHFLGGRSFWWDVLAAADGSGLHPDIRGRALGELRGEDAAVRTWATEQGMPLADVPRDLCAASEDELLFAAARPGITLGAHTWRHPNLVQLTPAERADELALPLAWLGQRVSSPLAWLAYPYGLFDASVERAAADAGYEAALAVSGGWLPANPTRPFSLPRVNIPRGLSASGFVLRGADILAR
jgi:peptidoglycan/xylan/chitin deacetylase (PgdA/CDA1 family)